MMLTAVSPQPANSPHQLAASFRLSKHPTSRLTSPGLFGLTLTRGRSEARSPIALRWTIHLLARLGIAAMCTGSAAAFDAGHIFRAAGVIAGHTHRPRAPHH